MSVPNASSSSNIISYAANPNYTRTEGFKAFKKVYNCRNNCIACDDPNMLYPPPEVIYNQVKNSRCSEREFKSLSLQDFIVAGSISARCHMKQLSLAPYYQIQMECFTGKWDMRDNQGEGTEVVDFCCQVIGVVGTSLYHSMADVQATVGWLMC